MRDELTEENISRLAHQYWIEDGCPDGEKPAYALEGCTIKLKEVHWERAKAMLKLKAAKSSQGVGSD